jgi:Acetyltransferase (GNAT) domain
VEFNEVKWRLRAVHWQTPGSSQDPTLAAVFYTDRKGRLKLPPLNPYLPVVFRPTKTQQASRLQRQWVAAASELAAAMGERGLVNTVMLPPDVTDVRPWQWRGVRATVRYTCVVPFPFTLESADPAVRNSIRKAVAAEYSCELVAPSDRFVECLAQSERRQGFQYGLTRADLDLAYRLLTPDRLRLYACFDSMGSFASVRVILHSPGTQAIDWVAASTAAHLQHGSTQLLIGFVLQDLQRAGATSFDFGGANLPTVAAAKLNWAAHLKPMYALETRSARTLVKDVFRWTGWLS